MRNSLTVMNIRSLIAPLLAVLLWLPMDTARGQRFDFDRLDEQVRSFSVIVEIKIELSFGTHTNEHGQRLLGTVVSDDGLVIFDGGFLNHENTFSMLAGYDVRTTPTSIEVSTFDDKTYEAEYLGIDRFTQIAFAKIQNADDVRFDAVKFVTGQKFKLGDWVALYMLLPEFISPPLAADIGMISSLIESPETFALTVGFSELELSSVLFDEQARPVGVLGSLLDPSSARTNEGGFVESFDQFNVPLLGVITGERLQKMIASPPQRGKIDRAWLGITLQALTRDIGEFLNIDAAGGIIVNDVVGDSPAEMAGLRVGDVIYQINGQPVEVDREERLPVFQRQIARMGPGTSVEFSVLRPDDSTPEELRLSAVLEKAPLSATDAPEYHNETLEFKIRDLVFADFHRYNQDRNSFKGVVVSELQRGGLASLGGLQIGDVIQRVGNTIVTSMDEMEAAMDQVGIEQPREIIFFVWRLNKTMFVNVKTDWQ